MKTNIPITVPPKTSTTTSDDNNSAWEHDTTRQERDHLEEIETDNDLDMEP